MTTDLPMMGLREFRDGIADIKEPVRVVKTRNGITDLGVWIPNGTTFSIHTGPRKDVVVNGPGQAKTNRA